MVKLDIFIDQAVKAVKVHKEGIENQRILQEALEGQVEASQACVRDLLRKNVDSEDLGLEIIGYPSRK